MKRLSIIQYVQKKERERERDGRRGGQQDVEAKEELGCRKEGKRDKKKQGGIKAFSRVSIHSVRPLPPHTSPPERWKDEEEREREVANMPSQKEEPPSSPSSFSLFTFLPSLPCVPLTLQLPFTDAEG